MKKILLILVMFVAVQLQANEILGEWSGTMSAYGMKIPVVFIIMESGEGVKTKMLMEEGGIEESNFDSTTFSDSFLEIIQEKNDMKYLGKLREDGKTIEGHYHQRGYSFELNLNKKEPKIEKGNKAVGDWKGIMKVMDDEFKLAFHIKEGEGGLDATMDIIDQGLMGEEMSSVVVEGNKITIKHEDNNVTVEGEFSEDGNTIKGTWSQNGYSFPLDLERQIGEEKVELRPQDPTEFPYIQENVIFINKKEEIALAGTLTLPQNKKFKKVVVLISGSGPQNRDEEIKQFNHRPFLVLSDYLTRNGIAVLRYDERGVGESEGEFSDATSRDFANDVNVAVSYLASRKDMKGKKIGLAGHSEGGMIAPLVASENKNVDFVIMLAGPGIDTPELMLLQNEKISLAAGAPQNIVDGNIKTLRPMYEYIVNHPNQEKEELTPKLKEIFKEGVKKNFPEAVQASVTEDMIDKTVEEITGKWFVYFMRNKPKTYLSKVTCPVLAINGSLDLQVTPKENLAGIKQILEDAGNKNVTIKEIQGQNHLFQTATTGATSEYPKIEETFNEGTMKYITKWINKLK